MTSQGQHIGFDVEQRLCDDASGQYRAELRARLGEMQSACALARRQLHDRDTYRRIEAAMAAVAAAATVLELMPRAGAARRQ
ncbi:MULTISPECIES: hypothetical protein [unclassified Variovorax]|uniref:hypothetical protein n=1 Tax=unclassified Variovorax TaxID=663243 RepID=UPI00076CACD2|nr:MULTISPECIES: hypothetical protein [unclassified Variovorax]KWT92114.1 hypothetical protein APY03_3028 [Variovorax sp. WDL1]PNG46984.1 hypothetical protein CHC06_07327 [Variovorax sp. B2]PNG48365.1 hypothetical protein CHC07_07541 [Variovorax sp. B4]VTV14833.1 hypothetical protein WDL1CHR_05301 [Variovorax sp. WDL1]